MPPTRRQSIRPGPNTSQHSAQLGYTTQAVLVDQRTVLGASQRPVGVCNVVTEVPGLVQHPVG